MAAKEYTMEEIQKHNKPGDAWIVVEGAVYNVSMFADLHPGGAHVLLQQAGTDATEWFKLFHNDTVLGRYEKFRIGTLKGYKPPARMSLPGAFGNQIPYGDPSWYQRMNTPYYKETHRKFREKVRQFVDTEILPTFHLWRDEPTPPRDIVLKMGKLGFLACMGGPPFPKEYVDPGVEAPEDFDYFHEMILYDEVSRCGHAGVIAALTNGPSIGLTAILRFGSEEMKRRIAPDVLMGRKYIALAVSEPNAGSDVAGLALHARREGDFYVLNGNKKWITNGTYADYFVTAIVTGKPGQGGLSFLLVERGIQGFETRKIKIRGTDVSGTAYLDFYNAKVPVKNLIGKENDGFKLIMYNFNHERFYVTVCMARLARVCLEESIKYAMRRKTFGKYLFEHQAIRMKIASMARMVEQLQHWLDVMCYQLCTMSHAEANMKIGDIMCLLKVQGSKVYEHCARETTMVFGGNALHTGGPGDKIEPAVAQVKGYQIPAGAEDIMDDYGARTVFKLARQFAKL